jgi:hypothetical protein
MAIDDAVVKDLRIVVSDFGRSGSRPCLSPLVRLTPELIFWYHSIHKDDMLPFFY